VRVVFADTHYWVALANQRDQKHKQARRLREEFKRERAFLLTSELVLAEFLAFFSSYGPLMRKAAARMVEDVLGDAKQIRGVKMEWQSEELFKSGLRFYGDRLDKGYSLTDCISMTIMNREGLKEVATNDKHFTQEGFSILLP
jgi:predicted nucleic acid-binding protein